MIRFDHVTSKYRGGILCLNDVSFHIEQGSFTALLGPSGAGKSTILWHILGELIPGKGNISCMGVDPSSLSYKKKMHYRRKIGFVPQNLMLLEHRNVYDNVNIMLRGISMGSKSAEIRTENALDLVGLRHKAGAYPYQLSGGEQQRLAIARALSVNPVLLLADEPTGNLDPIRSEEIMGLFKKIHEMGITVVVATHEWSLMQKLGAEALYVETGCIAGAGKEAEERCYHARW